LCFGESTFDLIWSCNTINHVSNPVDTLRGLRSALRPGGRVVLAQSGLLPEMYFAWDAPLDDAVRRACHAYYRERYGLTLADTAGVRGLVRQLRAAGFRMGRVRTINIERVQPLSAADREYFASVIFEGSWAGRLQPFLAASEWEALRHYTEASSPGYCLDRDDFHHLQTLTICEGHG
jgi:SAM-dependent methyltransferase